MQSEKEIAAERLCEVTAARLGVAEDLRWYIAFLMAMVVHLKWDTFIGAGVAFVLTILVIPYWYDKEYEAARDAQERLTKTGKYFQPVKQEASEN